MRVSTMVNSPFHNQLHSVVHIGSNTKILFPMTGKYFRQFPVMVALKFSRIRIRHRYRDSIAFTSDNKGSLLAIFSSVEYSVSRIMTDDLQKRIQAALANPQNMGEMACADAIDTVGNADCGEMLRL